MQLIKSPLRESQEPGNESQDNVEEVLIERVNGMETLTDNSSDNKAMNGNLIQTIPLLENIKMERNNGAVCQSDVQLNVPKRNEKIVLPRANSHMLNNIRYLSIGRLCKVICHIFNSMVK